VVDGCDKAGEEEKYVIINGVFILGYLLL